MSPEDFRLQTAGAWELPDVSGEYVNEQNLFDSFIVESNDIYGLVIDYYSLVFNEDEADVFYGENQNEYFKGPYRTKVAHRPHDEVDLINMFGMSSQDEVEDVYIPQWSFDRDCPLATPPKAGDLVYFYYSHRYYEVNKVEDEFDVFQSKRFTYMFKLKSYRMTNVDASESLEISAGLFPLSAWGDNDFIETAANEVDDLSDLPNFTDIYGIGD
jgi:hypothetical protein